MVTVIQLMRRPQAGAYSIERVYASIRAQLPVDLHVRVVIAARPSRGLLPRVRSAWQARRGIADVYHVTGDVHFLTAFLNKARTILTIHDCIFLERATGLKYLLLYIFWFWLPEKRCTRIVVISEHTKERLLAHLRCHAQKVTVIPNPVASEFVYMPAPTWHTAPRILQIGTKPNKNLERLVEALKALNVTLVIVGSLTALQQRAIKSAGIDCEMRAKLSDAELRAEYAAAHVVSFVSTEEGFGLPILEAQATGRPVVTSALAPMADVAGDGACLVDPFDVRSIREGFSKVLNDPAYRAAIVERGFANVERYRAEAIADRYAALYREVAASANRPGR